MISSPENQHLKELRKLTRRAARDRTGRFVAEGEDLQSAAFAAGIVPVVRLCPPGLGRQLSPEGDDGDWLEVDEPLLARVSTLGSGTRAIGIYEQHWAARPSGPLCVYLDGVGDPGNVGTILRSAHAFGASSVAIGPDCADPYGPKAVRASMGAIFSLQLARAVPEDLPGELIGLVADAPQPLRGPLTGTVSLLIGSERHGLRPDVLARCDRLAAIAQVAGDSLNAAMAATVALYELTRDAPAPRTNGQADRPAPGRASYAGRQS
jgi:RNA methyltransferase, TrmH family